MISYFRRLLSKDNEIFNDVYRMISCKQDGISSLVCKFSPMISFYKPGCGETFKIRTADAVAHWFSQMSVLSRVLKTS